MPKTSLGAGSCRSESCHLHQIWEDRRPFAMMICSELVLIEKQVSYFFQLPTEFFKNRCAGEAVSRQGKGLWVISPNFMEKRAVFTFGA